MPTIMPSTITKAVIKEIVEDGLKLDPALEKMIELWEDAFPLIAYLDDKDVVAKRKANAKQKAPAKKTATDALKAEITFDELWGGDINDQTAYAGLAMEAAAAAGEEVNVKPVELHGHLAEGLTRSQLARTGFKEHGGLVITLLNPMIKAYEANVRIGSHLFFRAQRYRIVEKTSILKWEEIKGNLYTVINCLIG